MIDPNFDPMAIPLGHTCDDDDRVLSYRDETGLWYVYTYDDAGRVLSYREKDKFWYVYIYTYDDDGKYTITRTRESPYAA
jgi:YD repeat-containing protein